MHIYLRVLMNNVGAMARNRVVRAREHRGTSSLNLTIPAWVCKEFKVKAGDAFEISPTDTSAQLSITYRRIYKAHD